MSDSSPPAATITMDGGVPEVTTDPHAEYGPVVEAPPARTLDDELVQIDQKMKDQFGIKVGLNTRKDVILANVAANIRRGFPQVWPHGLTDQHVCIVGGGWSLTNTFDELRELYWSGAKIVACNGAAKWLTDRNIRPSAVVVLDARETNLRFVEQDIPDCKFFLASQCHPSLFDAVKGRDSYIFHVCATDSLEEKKVLDDYYVEQWQAVSGTCCVGFRALCLFRTLGFQLYHLFGIDSCYAPNGRHHAYLQPENDDEQKLEVACGDRNFEVSSWQLSQAIHFVELLKHMGDQFWLDVHGDGLIAHMIATGATLGKE